MTRKRDEAGIPVMFSNDAYTHESGWVTVKAERFGICELEFAPADFDRDPLGVADDVPFIGLTADSALKLAAAIRALYGITDEAEAGGPEQ